MPDPRPATPPRTWDLFCTLIDNFGDVGVSWRLAADLAARGERVRLWADDPGPLGFMAPDGQAGVEVRRWPADDEDAWPAPGDAVIELFGCHLPQRFVDAMAAAPRAPVWLNLEYLSAEAYVERSHGLPSPQSSGLRKWFFYPGFTPRTGGLLREPGLLAARDAFDRDAWLATLGVRRQPGERVATLFCYPNPSLPALLQALVEVPTVLLLTPGHAQKQVQALAGSLPATLRTVDLPWLKQPEFDRALWASDLNLVRGEDSLVRAIWAGAPFLWQVYPMEDEIRERKLAALLGLMNTDDGPPGLWPVLDVAARQYCALGAVAPHRALVLPEMTGWRALVEGLRRRLAAQDDLVSALQRFVDRELRTDGVE